MAWMFRRYPRSLIESTVAGDQRLNGRVAGGWRNLLGIQPTVAA